MKARRERRLHPARQGVDRSQVYGDWLEELDWDYWATWTFEEEFSLPSCRRAIVDYLEEVNPSVAWWVTELGAAGTNGYIVQTDRGVEEGRAHLHGLLSFGEDVPQATHLWHRWHRQYGRAHVDRFDKQRGAAHYVGKYVTKKVADYDVYRRNSNLFN
jgi:hypothetical protein